MTDRLQKFGGLSGARFKYDKKIKKAQVNNGIPSVTVEGGFCFSSILFIIIFLYVGIISFS